LGELEVPYEMEVYHRTKIHLAPEELGKVHPLQKSPVVTITPPGGGKDIVLAEGPFIAEYLNEHWGQGKNLAPKRWKEGQEGKIGGETDEWMRYQVSKAGHRQAQGDPKRREPSLTLSFQYLMYYIEGSFFPQFLVYLILNSKLPTLGVYKLSEVGR
jgi:glutathione S-transferase